jgi:hypothetical protein
VTPGSSRDLVQLEISDAPSPPGQASMAEDATIRVTVEAKIRAYKAPLIAHFQMEAIVIAMESLRAIHTALEKETIGHGLPAPRNPK